MEDKELKRMIERFFDAELSVDEERMLCRYLRENDVPAELRKDKEVVLALCSEVNVESVLPSGATERLEAMLDELEQKQEYWNIGKGNVAKPERKIFKIPRYISHSIVAAAVVVMAYILMVANNNEFIYDSKADTVALLNEEDTFDNPEDAMQCLKLVFGDMQHATAIAHANTKKIGAVLELSATMCNKK